MNYFIDKFKFEKNNKLVGCSNSAYTINTTTCCDNYCVYDEELDRLFYNPKDLSQSIFFLIR